MFTRSLFLSLVVCCLSLCASAFSLAEEASQSQQKMVEEYMKLMAPGENHAYLSEFVGKWDVETTAWMTPDAPPSKAKNKAEATLLLGGRFLMMEFSGTMFGQPFEGIQIIGYDNFKKKYITFWIDNQSTGFYLTEGTRDATTGVLTETADWPDPTTGYSIKVRGVTTPVGKDEHLYEMFMTPSGEKEFKVFENKMTRRKGTK